jgi:hypothetical protein
MLRGWINYFRLTEQKGVLEEYDQVDTAQAGEASLATVEAACHAAQKLEEKGALERTCLAICKQRAWPVVERKRFAHESGVPQFLVRQ